MPFKSKAQERWANSPSGHKALGDKGVKEWDEASKGMKLPEKVKGKSIRGIPVKDDGPDTWGIGK